MKTLLDNFGNKRLFRRDNYNLRNFVNGLLIDDDDMLDELEIENVRPFILFILTYSLEKRY